ncbi:MAG: SHOCT domain-containing protein [Candidatus Neomarinimicrobiota bacterium]|nr:MAG: SHOCT domain-containing protein [Candidatus Neomarinimicrobiota bacterium]
MGMHWIGGGWMMILWWILLTAAGIGIFHWLRPGASVSSGNDTPLDILKKRFARGEIDAEEFERRKRQLL